MLTHAALEFVRSGSGFRVTNSASREEQECEAERGKKGRDRGRLIVIYGGCFGNFILVAMDRWASKRTNDNSFGFIVDEERSRVWSFRFCREREDMDTCQVIGECWRDRQVGPGGWG